MVRLPPEWGKASAVLTDNFIAEAEVVFMGLVVSSEWLIDGPSSAIVIFNMPELLKYIS